MAKYDVVVVGGGPGGLVAAGILAKEGLQTLLIEKFPVLGGRCRAIDFHGCRVDLAIHPMHGLFKTPEGSWVGEACKRLGVDVKLKEIPWSMGLIGGKRAREFLTIQREKEGIEGFFDLFAFMSGIQLGDKEREELRKIFDTLGKMSLEACREYINVGIDEWVEENVENMMVKFFFLGTSQLTSIPAEDVSMGYIAVQFSDLSRLGGSYVYFYPSGGVLGDTLIPGLAQAIKRFGGEIATDTTVRKIVVENGGARGVLAVRNKDHLHFEVEAPIVVCAVPLFESVGKGKMLDEEVFPEKWLKTIKRMAQYAHDDYSSYYLLKEEIIPPDDPQWVQAFDVSSGIPTYAGDYAVASTIFEARVPGGKQLVARFYPGPLLGLDPSPEIIRDAHQKAKSLLEKAYPGFSKAIEYEGYMLCPGNWGRYYMITHEQDLGFKSPQVKGLYFAGDSSTILDEAKGPLTVKTVFTGMKCAETVLKDRQ